jgi:hypothetical protein
VLFLARADFVFPAAPPALLRVAADPAALRPRVPDADFRAARFDAMVRPPRLPVSEATLDPRPPAPLLRAFFRPLSADCWIPLLEPARFRSPAAPFDPRPRAPADPRLTSLMNRLPPPSWINAASLRESNVSNHWSQSIGWSFSSGSPKSTRSSAAVPFTHAGRPPRDSTQSRISSWSVTGVADAMVPPSERALNPKELTTQGACLRWCGSRIEDGEAADMLRGHKWPIQAALSAAQ